MNASRIAILICFAVLIGTPLLFRPQSDTAPASADALSLIIITPHNEQIRYEFARAFDAWHRANFGQAVNVMYSVPGGTSEIRKMLESQYAAAIEAGQEPGGAADLVFGGGSFEHGRLKRGVRIVKDGQDRWEPISAPVDFSSQWLQQIYGENRIGDDPLYDPDRYWFGLALSGFGIVFNRDVLQELHVPEPQNWDDLGDPRLQGWIALVNPKQSGSVTTAFDSILKREGWVAGWRTLRRMAANHRYFSASSLKPPIDVSQGNAAMGVCIDFFGRYQSQALKESGDADRIGYIDPIGGSTIDADPISLLRNAPHPELAKRFIEFCLSDQGQALWQFHRRSEPANPGENALGPAKFELRRLPIVRSMYERYSYRFIDQVNPFESVEPMEHPDPNYRDFIAPMFAAMAMDSHRELKQAWRAIADDPEFQKLQTLLSPGQLNAETLSALDLGTTTLREMLALFDAMPPIAEPGGVSVSMADSSKLGEIRAGWLRGDWADKGLWDPQSSPADEMRRQFGEFFRNNYRRIVELAEKK